MPATYFATNIQSRNYSIVRHFEIDEKSVKACDIKFIHDTCIMLSILSLNLQQVPVSKPEGRTLCTLIPGDGVGPELMQSMKDVLEVFNLS